MLETPVDSDLLSEEMISEALARVLNSSGFIGSPRLQQFLRYTVERTLRGEWTDLKEACIGVHVFGKLPSYDPKTEPIVRVEARRLRSRLQEYYADAGKNDNPRISIPKGGYQARFELATPVLDHPKEPEPQELELIAAAPEELATILATNSVDTSPPHAPYTSPRTGLSWTTFVVISLLASAITIFLLQRNQPRPLVFSRVVPLVSGSDNELEPSISHDGKQIAFVSGGAQEKNYDIYVKLLDVGEAVRLTNDSAPDLRPQWSPDDRYIAFERVLTKSIEVMVIPALGGHERKLAEIHIPPSWKADPIQGQEDSTLAWTSDGSGLIVTDNLGTNSGSRALFLIPIEGSTRRQLTNPVAPASDVDASISHSGRQIAFIRETTNSASDIFLSDTDGTNAKQITFDHMLVSGIAWAPGDQYLVFASNRGGAEGLWEISIRGGKPISIPSKGDEVASPTLSSDGSVLAYTATTDISNIWRIDLGTTNNSTHAVPQLLIASNGRNHSAKYSPDGTKIVFVSDRSGTWEIWVCDATGKNLRQLTHFGGPMVGTPHWSPDSQHLVFDSRPDGKSVIFVVALDGSQPVKVIDDRFEDKKPNWSRDGNSLYYTSNRNGFSQLWKSGIHGEHPIQLTTEPCNDTAESMDGKTLYFQTEGNGFYQMPASGGPAKLIPTLSNMPASRYFNVSERIVFLRQEKDRNVIAEYDPLTHRLASLGIVGGKPVYGTPSLSISPDHRYALYAQEDNINSRIITLRR